MAVRDAESLRADAQLNRDRIIEVARRTLATSGDASLNSIAKLAGVGPGTLYRHFPTREALILEVYLHEVQELADSATDLLENDTAIDALRGWIERLATLVRIKHGLGDALNTAANKAIVDETYAPAVGAIGALLRAGEADGSIRPGRDRAGILLLIGFMWRSPTGAEGDAQASRTLELVLDGLRAQRA